MKDCFTTIEQSAKLVELGFDTKTADGYRKFRDQHLAHVQPCNDFEDFLDKSKLTRLEVTPCWSGIKLIELFPVCIGSSCDYWLEVNKNFVGYNIEERKPGRTFTLIEGEGSTVVDKLVSVAQQLIENEYWDPKEITQF